jgi:hypothetical protein
MSSTDQLIIAKFFLKINLGVERPVLLSLMEQRGWKIPSVKDAKLPLINRVSDALGLPDHGFARDKSCEKFVYWKVESRNPDRALKMRNAIWDMFGYRTLKNGKNAHFYASCVPLEQDGTEWFVSVRSNSMCSLGQVFRELRKERELEGLLYELCRDGPSKSPLHRVSNY